MTNLFKIKAGLSPAESVVELNGEALDGVVRVSFDFGVGAPRGPMLLKLEIWGEVVVDGELREEAVLRVEQGPCDVELNEAQRGLARHALGLPNKHGKPYRNHFVTGDGSTDYPHWDSMVEAGAATVSRGNVLSGGDDVFRLTPAGVAAALDPGESPE